MTSVKVRLWTRSSAAGERPGKLWEGLYLTNGLTLYVFGSLPIITCIKTVPVAELASSRTLHSALMEFPHLTSRYPLYLKLCVDAKIYSMPMSCPPSRAELPLETISSGHHRTTPPAPIVRPCIFPFPSPLPFPASHPRIHPAEVITHAVNFAALPFSRPSIANQEKNIQEPPPLLKPIQHLLYSSMSSLPLCPFFVGLHFTSLPLPSSSPLLCRFITSSSFSHPLISRTFTNLFYILLQQP